MDRVYECDASKKAELIRILEADPYSEDSFARAGYKVKDGLMIEEDKEKIFVYISASDEFLKKADERLKDLAKPASEEVQKRVKKKIEDEEATVAAGVSMFGD
ncbi:MAG: hypothetical protein ABII71_05600 [Candidatus Micrarchaeota archaeon]